MKEVIAKPLHTTLHPAKQPFDVAHDSGHEEFLNVLDRCLAVYATAANAPSSRVAASGDIRIADLLTVRRTLRNAKCPA
jgi:hypothetical protein